MNSKTNSRILQELKPYFDFLFYDYGFKQIEGSNSEYFGDSISIICSNDFCLRLIKDKGQIFIEIGLTSKDEKWFDINLVIMHLDNSKIYKKYSILEIRNFLLNNYENVKNLFIKNNIENSEKILEELKKERLKEMFPRIK